jgi:uncharacterized protein (UPF0548 family)
MDMTTETITREFDVAGRASLTLKNIRGSVEVRAGDERVVTVTAVKHLRSGDAKRTEIEIHQEEDGSVIAETLCEKNVWSRQQPCRVDYSVHVPRTCSLSVHCVSSSTAVQGLEGRFALKSISGVIALQELGGRIRATSVSGDIVGKRLRGPLRLKSVSGQVLLIDSDVTACTGSSVSGDLVLQTPLGEGPYGFETVSGNVCLFLPPESRCTVEAASVSGRFRSALPVTRSRRRRGRVHADLQGGGPKVRFKTISGNLAMVPLPEDDSAAGMPDCT